MEDLQAQPQAEQEKEAETTPQTIKVKYNHEELELPHDEATALIQKGMNYDKIKEKLDTLSNSKALKILNDRAKKLGIDADTLAERLDKNISESEVKELADAKGYSEEDARLIMEAEEIKKQNAESAEKARLQAERDAQITAQAETFNQKYPDINVEKDLPGEVVDLWINQKIPLIVAYKAYLADNMPETKKEIKAMQEDVNKENAKASMGDVLSKGDSEVKEFTAETVKSMTSEQRRKYMPDILAAIRAGKLQA